jgi:hypothetical protein
MKAAHTVGIVAVILFCIVVAFYNNAFSGVGYPAPGTQYNPPYVPRVPVPSGPMPTGTFKMVDNAYDALDISTALTIGSGVDQSFWAHRSNWILLGAHGATGTNVEITDADQGYIYVMMEPHSSSAYLADTVRTIAMNSRADSAQFVDVDGDNRKEIMIKWNMANVPAAASGYPSTTFTGYYLADISASASLNMPTGFLTTISTSKTTSLKTTSTSLMTSLSTDSTVTTSTASITTSTTLISTTITSMSTSTSTYTDYSAAAKKSYFPVYMTLGTVRTGVAISKIEVKCNTINSGKATFISINVPGKGLVLASNMAYSVTDTSQIWSLNIGSDLSKCLYWTYPLNTFDKQDLTTGIQTTLASGDVIQWTISIYMINYAQTVVIASGTFTTTTP